MNEFGYKTVSIKFVPQETWKLLHLLKTKKDKQFWEVVVDALHQYVSLHSDLKAERVEINYPEKLEDLQK